MLEYWYIKHVLSPAAAHKRTRLDLREQGKPILAFFCFRKKNYRVLVFIGKLLISSFNEIDNLQVPVALKTLHPEKIAHGEQVKVLWSIRAYLLMWSVAMVQINWSNRKCCTRKEFNSHRIGLVHNMAAVSLDMLENQYGCHDIMWKCSVYIESTGVIEKGWGRVKWCRVGF